ncbi:hypothetical protein H2200_004579 [Cladophialophora chaetospira]|uniref:Uncharacterized protein n=1 Tax=Cladophialophora chaetospira TaxID=386627 RepID=A0AA38XDK2_9EURO|nr:hypothetical protein H2200_004579 [Cladophialophora chaetospira]
MSVQLNDDILCLITNQVIVDLETSRNEAAYKREGLFNESAHNRAELVRSRQTLFNLRLSSNRFANYGPISRSLFGTVFLRAMKGHESRLQQLPRARFCPFVKKIVFVPSPYSVQMSLEEYKDLFLVQLVHLSHPQYEFRDDDDALFMAQEYKKKHWKGLLPITDREVETAYEWYKVFAREDQAFVCTGRLQNLFTTALRKFDAAREYQLSFLVDCWPHTMEGTARAIECDFTLKYSTRLAAQSGDLLFDCVAKCLVSAGKHIESLRLDCALKEVFGGNWHSPYYPTSPPTVYGPLNFPKLRMISLRAIEIPLAELGAAILASPILKELIFAFVEPTGPATEWRYVFDAIRENGNIDKIVFDDFWDVRGDYWSYYFWRAEGDDVFDIIPNHGRAQVALAQYLYKQGEWTDELDELLDDS